MSLLLASAIAATVVPIAEIDLASPTIYVSKNAREAVASGTVQKFVCFDLPERSRKFRSACLTSIEWREAVERSKLAARGGRTSEEMNGLPQEPVPIQTSPYQSSWGPR